MIRLGVDGKVSLVLNRAQLNGGSAWSAFREPDGALIVAAGDGGVVRVSQNGEVTTLLSLAQLGQCDDCKAIFAFRDSDGALIVTVSGGGVVRIEDRSDGGR